MLNVTTMKTVFSILICFALTQACPDNCFCENYEAECTIVNCESTFPVEELDILVIRGGLCGFQRMMLHDNTQTKIILRDDFCYNIGNCK